jgi:hypothetical protein
MHDWMTRRHEGCVSTMLTDKRLKYFTTAALLQGSGATKWRMQADKHGFSGCFSSWLQVCLTAMLEASGAPE